MSCNGSVHLVSNQGAGSKSRSFAPRGPDAQMENTQSSGQKGTRVSGFGIYQAHMYVTLFPEFTEHLKRMGILSKQPATLETQT